MYRRCPHSPLQHLSPTLRTMNDFRNSRVVHVERPLTDPAEAEENVRLWLKGLVELEGVCREG